MDLEQWADDLVRYLDGHADRERDILREYQSAASTATDGDLGALLQIIVSDEMRHHQIFSDMAAAVREMAAGSRDRTPMPAVLWAESRQRLLDRTRELIAVERQDAEELAGLRKVLGQVEDTKPWAVVVEAMEMDTAKHILLLEHIERTA